MANAETTLILKADTFADCTGDALVADLAGCAWRMGSESREETGETHAPESVEADTMGNSIHIRARDIGRDAPFTPPDWAVKHDDPSYFYDQGRRPNDPNGGFWWIEIGVPWHTIYDNETIRHELTRHALGIWDWMKNHDPEMCEKTKTYALDWIGQVTGKRESRRVIGLHWLTETELHANEPFADEIALAGGLLTSTPRVDCLHQPASLPAQRATATTVNTRQKATLAHMASRFAAVLLVMSKIYFWPGAISAQRMPRLAPCGLWQRLR